MNDWLKKVEEMKKLRPEAAPSNSTSSITNLPSSTTTTNPTANSTPNKFLSKVQSSSNVTAASTDSPSKQSRSVTVSSTTSTPMPNVGTNSSKPNPFLMNKTLSTTNINRTENSNQVPSTTTNTPASIPASTKDTPTSSSGNEVGSGIWKVKYEQEVKRRQELELRLKSIEQTVISSPSTAASVVVQQKREARKTKRMTKKIVDKQRMSIHVMNTVDNVLSQIGGLDRKIKAAEAAKLQAEDKLLDIAIAKLEVDEVVQKVDTVLKKLIEQIDKFTIPQIKEMLIKVKSQTASDIDGGSSKASTRFSIMLPQGGLNLDTEIPSAPDFTPNSPPSVSNRNNPSTTKTSLLESIRAGATLRNVNVDKLREEQKQLRANAKQTITSIKSLEETLRDALTNRFNDMGIEEEDEEDRKSVV